MRGSLNSIPHEDFGFDHDNLEFLAHHYDQRHRSKMKYIHSEETLQVPEGGEYTQFQSAKTKEAGKIARRESQLKIQGTVAQEKNDY